MKTIHAFSFWLSILVTLTAGNHSLGQSITRAGQDSWHRTGLLCFSTGTEEKTRVHLVKFDGQDVRMLFVTGITNTVLFSPVCLSNSVVVVDVEGVISKLDLEGEFVFRTRPKTLEGTVSWSGKLSEKNIFVTETLWNERARAWKYQLHIFDVTGKSPEPISKLGIIQPLRVVRTSTEIVVVGEKDCQRLELSKSLPE